MLSVKPEYSSRIGIHISSVAPGKTVDSNITKSPFLRLLPTTKHALFNGNKSGSCDDVTPVGTHITKTLQSLIALLLETIMLFLIAAFIFSSFSHLLASIPRESRVVLSLSESNPTQ